MIVERTGQHVVVRERLNLDARRGQEARLIGALRMAGVRGNISLKAARVEGVATIGAAGLL